jgi:ATP-dependent helicase/nuclease subunit A
MSPLSNLSILASAGTGKTFRLSDRIIQLLAQEGVEHQNIAALTFTRAAAAEFIVKLVQKLQEAATDEKVRLELCDRIGIDAAAHDKKWFQDTLRTTLLESNRMTMGTLDSFFAKLVRSFPLEVGIQTGVATTVSDHEADDLRMTALQDTLNRMNPQETSWLLTNLRNFNDGEDIANPMETLAEMAKAHHELMVTAPDEEKWGNDARIWKGKKPKWSGYADKDLGAEWDILSGAISKNHDDAPPDKWPTQLRLLPGIVADRSPKSGDVNTVLEYLHATMTSQMGEASSYQYNGKPKDLDADASDAARRLLYKAMDKVVRSKLAQTKALFQCLSSYEKSYDTVNRKQGQLGFSDYVTLLTRAPQFKQEEIAFRLDGKINHWLLDEFQDTSTLQFKVLKQNIDNILSTSDPERSVFVVGDLKQSLYEWRSGNRKLLEKLDRDIAANGQSVPLDATRRCAQPVLDLVNLILTYQPNAKGTYPDYFGQEAAADWSKNFRTQKSHTDEGKPAKKGESYWYRLAKTPGRYNPTQESRDQAVWIAEHLWKTDGLLDDDGRLNHGITCAVLVSKNKQAATLAEELRKRGVQASEEAKSAVIEDNPVTAGLAGIIRAIVHPDNGLQQGLAEISPASKSVIDGLGGWSATTQAITQTFHQEGAEAMVDLLVKHAHPATKQDPFITKRLTQFRTIAVRYDGTGRRDLTEFADYLGKNELRDSADSRTVQILTIHRSKGLEYDIVYMPCLNDSSRPIAHLRRGDLLSMPTNEAALDFSPAWLLGNVGEAIAEHDPVLKVAVAKAKGEAAYGGLCKLYVGMTRARHRLIMLTMPLSKDRAKLVAEPQGNHDFATLLESKLKNSGQNPVGAKLKDTNECELLWTCPSSDSSWLSDRIKKQAKAATVIPGCRDSRQYAPVDVMEQLRPSKAEKPKDEEPPQVTKKKKKASKLDPRELGNAVHALLEHVDKDVEAFIKALPGLQVPAELRHARDEAAEIALNCAQSSEFKKLIASLSPSGVLWKEREMAVSTEPGKLVYGKSDRIHIEPGKSATIIDYKTVDEDTTAEELRLNYQGQMDLYRKAVAKLCGLTPDKIRCVLVHVRQGAVIEA